MNGTCAQRPEEKLVQAGKLAVLGQMAASITHELNQPLATAAPAGRQYRRFPPARPTEPGRGQSEGMMVDVIERMGRITGQLRTFAHNPAPADVVPLHRCIGNALFLLNERLRGTASTWTCRKEDLMVMADAHRLDQVLVNLFGNAIDAMANAPERRPGRDRRRTGRPF